jgi:hypothetical protein
MISNQIESVNNDDATNDSSNFRETIFKKSYKFIQFQKKDDTPSKETTLKQPQHEESVQKFYNDLVLEGSTGALHSSQIKHKRKECLAPEVTVKKSKILNKSKKEFLKAADQNDLKLIQAYLEDDSFKLNKISDFELNMTDDFKWNVLMIAVAAFSNDVVKYLLESHSNHNQFKEIIYAQDLSGSDAEQLAIKCKNVKAAEMIQAVKFKIESGNLLHARIEEADKFEENKNDDNQQFLYCESCKKNFSLSDESHIEHVTSIVHQLNENEADCKTKKSQKINYHLRASTNKGYQILLKSGWNESGLGLNEQGRVQPIKAKQKLDRLGIGVVETKKVSQTIFNKKLFKLQRPQETNVKSVQSDFKMFKNLKELKKKNEKSKKMERNLRSYFNS